MQIKIYKAKKREVTHVRINKLLPRGTVRNNIAWWLFTGSSWVSWHRWMQSGENWCCSNWGCIHTHNYFWQTKIVVSPFGGPSSRKHVHHTVYTVLEHIIIHSPKYPDICISCPHIKLNSFFQISTVAAFPNLCLNATDVWTDPLNPRSPSPRAIVTYLPACILTNYLRKNCSVIKVLLLYSSYVHMSCYWVWSGLFLQLLEKNHDWCGYVMLTSSPPDST